MSRITANFKMVEIFKNPLLCAFMYITMTEGLASGNACYLISEDGLIDWTYFTQRQGDKEDNHWVK